MPLVGLGLVYPLTGPDPRVAPDDEAEPAASPGGAHWEHYLPTSPDPDAPPLSLDDLDLRGLPGTAVMTAAEHPRREQAERLIARLRAAEVTVTAIEHAGPPQDFLSPTRPGADAEAAIDELADFLSRLGDPYSFGGVPLS